MRRLTELQVGEQARVATLPLEGAASDLGVLQGSVVLLLRRIGRGALHVRVDESLECGLSVDLAHEILLEDRR